MRLLESGACEPLKCAIHAGVGVLAATCLVYNVAAFVVRRERHLRRNAWFYAVIVAVEIAHVRRHCP